MKDTRAFLKSSLFLYNSNICEFTLNLCFYFEVLTQSGCLFWKPTLFYYWCHRPVCGPWSSEVDTGRQESYRRPLTSAVCWSVCVCGPSAVWLQVWINQVETAPERVWVTLTQLVGSDTLKTVFMDSWRLWGLKFINYGLDVISLNYEPGWLIDRRRRQ